MFRKFFSSDDSEVNSKVATIFFLLTVVFIMVAANIVTTITALTLYVIDPQVLWVIAGIIIAALGADGLAMLKK